MSSSGAQSSPSTDFKRSGQDLDHIAAMLRQAIKGERSGDRNSFASEQPYDPQRRIPSLGTQVYLLYWVKSANTDAEGDRWR
jgi:hypothetical protein